MIRYIIEFQEPDGKEREEVGNAVADHARQVEDALHAHNLLQMALLKAYIAAVER